MVGSRILQVAGCLDFLERVSLMLSLTNATILATTAKLTLLAILLAPLPTIGGGSISDEEAQKAHANGSCGSLGPGTGLPPDGKGWIVSMLPGTHEFRIIGNGTVGITAAKRTVQSFDVGRPYLIYKTGDGELQWKVPGRDWGPVSKYFLYPPEGNIYERGQ